MAHYAHITNGIVDNVIVIDAETLALGHWGDPSEWVQTSYNTHANQHPEGRPLHKNYAGMGYTWDGTGFAPPQPYPSWTKDTNTYLWNPPVAMPVEEGKMFTWNEETLAWVEVTLGA
jgi:hypothetical protein